MATSLSFNELNHPIQTRDHRDHTQGVTTLPQQQIDTISGYTASCPLSGSSSPLR